MCDKLETISLVLCFTLILSRLLVFLSLVLMPSSSSVDAASTTTFASSNSQKGLFFPLFGSFPGRVLKLVLGEIK